MSPSDRALPLWLSDLSDVSNEAVARAGVMAGAAPVAVPVIVRFMFVRGRMTSGLPSGAVEG